MHRFVGPVALVALASLFQGTFGLGMKYTRPLAWEAWWLVYSVSAMLLLPIVCTFALIPNFGASIATSPLHVLWKGILYGFLWGVGGILFGKSVERVGMALTYGIVMGLAASVGSLIPLFSEYTAASQRALSWIVIGNMLMLGGVALSSWAGIRREKLTGDKVEWESGTGTIRLGLVLAILSGLLSALLNVGFAASQPIAARAVALGSSLRNASLSAWVVVLFGAFLMNAGYSSVLLTINGTWATFGMKRTRRAWQWAVASGLLWFAALAIYGQGAALMGSLGPVIGWPILLGLSLIVSSGFAAYTGEWKGAPSAMRWMSFAVFLLLIAVCCLSYGSRVNQ